MTSGPGFLENWALFGLARGRPTRASIWSYCHLAENWRREVACRGRALLRTASGLWDALAI
jgi:hypothetical protein